MQRFLLTLLLASTSATATAQLPQIRLNSVYPSGGQRGQSVVVDITGTDLDEATELVFSDPGLKATAEGGPNKFTVTIAAEVEPGLYDVRVRGLFGISNPRIFRIDTIAETRETEPNNTDDQAQEIAINTVVNAVANGGADVDVFKINASANQTIVIRSEAALVDSLMQPVLELFDAGGRRIAHARRKRQQDAVIVYTSPVDQILLLNVHDTVYAGGNDYGYRLSIDTRPQVDFISPAVLPFNVDTQVTLFGRHLPGGTPTDQTIDGTPLLQKSVGIKIDGTMRRKTGTDSSAASIDGIVYSGIDGNLLPVALESEVATVQPEATPVIAASEPQPITLPANVAGNFAVEMDEDLYRFDAKKGETWQIDVLADRLGSNADPLLIVEQISKDAEGKETAKRLAREEANKQNPGGNNLPTLTVDPSFTLSIPEDGTYQVRLKDRYSASRGDSRLTYSLSIRPTKPDFRVVLFDSYPSADGKAPPSTGAISLRKGGTYQVPIYVYRDGGFNEEIRIVSKETPAGVVVSDAVIPAGQTSTDLVITATSDAPEVASLLQLSAISTPGEITKDVKIATLVHGGANGLPRTGRITNALVIGIMKDEEPIHVQSMVTEVAVSQDQQLLIPLKLIRRTGFAEKVDVAFAGQPGNVDVAAVSIPKEADSAVARLFFKENAPAGPFHLMMYATAQVPYVRNPWQLEKAKAAVAEARAKVETATKAEAESKVIAESSQKKIVELGEMLKVYGAEITKATAELAEVKANIKQTLSGKADATKQLVVVQEQLQAAAANRDATGGDIDAAIKAIEDSTAAVQEAAKPVLELLKKIEDLNTQIATKQKLVAQKNAEIASTQEIVVAQQKASTDAAKLVAEAAETVKRLAPEVAALEASAKKAEDAAKPQNKNVRVVAVPIRLTVHATPGKLTAAIPDGGAIKKAATVDVKVTLVRKNNFAGPVKVALVLPESESRVTSNTVEIAADKTEAVIQLTAKADAAVGDIANAVIRATADFNSRQASFDAPVALKVTE